MLVYDLKRRSEFGTLQQHEGALPPGHRTLHGHRPSHIGACATGTVTCAEFWGGTHLLTGSEDKTIVVWRAKDWAALHTLRGHKYACCRPATRSAKLTQICLQGEAGCSGDTPLGKIIPRFRFGGHVVPVESEHCQVRVSSPDA